MWKYTLSLLTPGLGTKCEVLWILFLADFYSGQVIKTSRSFCASIRAWATYRLPTRLENKHCRNRFLCQRYEKQSCCFLAVLVWEESGCLEGWFRMLQPGGVLSDLVLLICCACKVWVRDLWLLMLTFYFTTWLAEWTVQAVAENSWMQPACGQIMAKPMKSRRGLCEFTACTDTFLVWDVSTSFQMSCSNKAKNWVVKQK